LLLFILYRYLYTPLFKILDKRQAELAKGLNDAEAATKERAELEASKTSILQSAREDGGKIVEDLRKQGIEEERRLLREAQERSIALLEESRKKAEDERAYILRESDKDVARMAVLAAEKILRGAKTGA
jgi:F-type H+-transporting ATPase subunit b